MNTFLTMTSPLLGYWPLWLYFPVALAVIVAWGYAGSRS